MKPTISELVETAKLLVRMDETKKTVLYGWALPEFPTEEQVFQIICIFEELGMHEPDMDEKRRWYLAGQCVCRMQREAGTTVV